MRAACAIAAFLITAAAAVPAALAQMPTVSPRGEPPPDSTPPAQQPAQPPQPVVIPVGPDGVPQVPAGEQGQEGYYHTDGLEQQLYEDDRWSDTHFGPVPEHHVVRKGDTLWDISWFYFNNPFEWPKVWSYNEHITNPHWIYPGDLVRLYPRGMTPVVDQPIDDTDAEASQPVPARRFGVSLRQLAYIDKDQLEFAGTIVGSADEKTLLSRGDAVYIEYGDRPPKVGKRYAVYTERQDVKHPDTGKVVGKFVRLLGEVEIASVKKDKRARGVITDSVDVIERGARVGPVQRTYQTVEPTPNEVDLQGTVVAMLESDELIGQGQVVFIDKGAADGLEVGNRMFVVRRGDAYSKTMEPGHNVGQDDRRFPARALGEILIVQTGEHAAVGLVTLAIQEMGVGDLVLMRKSRSAE